MKATCKVKSLSPTRFFRDHNPYFRQTPKKNSQDKIISKPGYPTMSQNSFVEKKLLKNLVLTSRGLEKSSSMKAGSSSRMLN